jgi:hypothetical protein
MPQMISSQQIADYIAAIERSKALGKSQRRLRLLEHLIHAENNGQGGTLKAYSIGLDVFDKPEGFDPSSDSIVRVEIGRLRTAIAVFEGSPFADTALKVEIAVGTYRPTLSLREQSLPDASLQELQPVFLRKPHLFGRIVLGVFLALIAVVLLVTRYVLAAPWAAITDPSAITIIVGSFEGDPALAIRSKNILKQSLLRDKSFSVLDAAPIRSCAAR